MRKPISKILIFPIDNVYTIVYTVYNKPNELQSGSLTLRKELPMTTYPFSKLSTENQAKARSYEHSTFITFAKPVFDGFQRFAIGNFGDIDQMLKEGWLVINMTA